MIKVAENRQKRKAEEEHGGGRMRDQGRVNEKERIAFMLSKRQRLTSLFQRSSKY